MTHSALHRLPICLALAIFALTLPAQEAPSFPYLTTSNGLVVATFNTESNTVEGVWPHIFAAIDSGQFVQPFAGAIRIETSEKPVKTFYRQNTHVIESQYPGFTVDYLASFISGKKILYVVARGNKNAVQSLRVTYESGAGQAAKAMVHLANPFESLPEHYAGKLLMGEFLKKIKGNTWEKTFLFSFTNALHTDSEVVSTEIARLQKQKGSLVDAEVLFMRRLIAGCKIPKSLTETERNVMEQCVSILKMSQVGEGEVFLRGRGQVLASLRPGIWHVAWVRDGAYAIQAMTRLGMYKEVRKALAFMLQADAGKFKHYRHTDGKDYGPGVDYQISLTRYFGNGKEECDYNEHGPNIEYDSWGLFLTTYSDYILRSGDLDFARQWAAVVEPKVAGAILAITDANGLIRADSGPWEHHLKDIKQYAFTSAVCARGLQLFAEVQRRLGRPDAAYSDGGERIRQGIFKNLLVENRFFKSNAQETDPKASEYHDAGSLEMFANGLLPDARQLFESNMLVYDPILRTEAPIPGYIRMRSDDIYENQEWVFINLRMAIAYKNYGQPEKSKQIINRLTGYAAMNHGQLPEMLSYINLWKSPPQTYIANEEWCYCVREKNNQFAGSTPMVGYGAGAWVLALLAD